MLVTEPVLVYTGKLSTEERLNASNAYLWAIDPDGYEGQQLWVDASEVGNEARSAPGWGCLGQMPSYMPALALSMRWLVGM